MKGEKFGRLIVLNTLRKKGREYCICKCECGVVKEIRSDALKAGVTVSCGCYGKEARLKSTVKHRLSKSTGNHPLYTVWDAMVQRCTNPKHSSYYLYGGRGIEICEEWRNNFLEFYNWSTNHGYKIGLQIDRINNNGNYCPRNCRWVTCAQNARNKRNNVFVVFNDERMCLQDVSNITGINRSTLYYRLKNGLELIR